MIMSSLKYCRIVILFCLQQTTNRLLPYVGFKLNFEIVVNKYFYNNLGMEGSESFDFLIVLLVI